MARIREIAILELCPGVKAEDFEKYVRQELYPNVELPAGYEGYLLKGEDGARRGEYLWVYEIESEEARDKARAAKWWETPRNKAIFDKWITFECRFNQTNTHYLAVE